MKGQGPLGGAGAKAASHPVVEATGPKTSTLPAQSAAILGWLVSGSAPGALLVDFPGNVAGPLRARSTVLVDEASAVRAVATRQPVALVFENGDARLPIVLGLLQEPPSPLQDLLQGASTSGADTAARAKRDSAPAPVAAAPGPVEARVDGKRVVITGEKEVTLQCGDASLTLRRDGKILLKGSYVETYARGTNRIKGAQVKIN